MDEGVRAALVAPLYARLGSLMLGHLAGLFLGVLAVRRDAGVWPAVMLAGLVIVLAARLVVLWRVRRLRGSERNRASLMFAPGYCLVGVAWAAISGVFCALCVAMAGTNDTVAKLAIILALGTCGGIASRNAGTPRFALTQLCAWLLPVATVASPLGRDRWALSVMLLLYLAALCSIVRQHYRDLIALLGTERANHALAKQFDAAISNMAQGLLLFDGDGRLQVVNRRFRELFAVPAERLAAGASIDEVAACCGAIGIADGGAADTAAEVSDVLDLPDGRALAVRRERLADGGRVITFEDISARRRAELALRANEETLRLSMAAGRIAGFRWDMAAGVLHCGAEVREMHGLPPGEGPLPQDEWGVTMLPEDRKRVWVELLHDFAERRTERRAEYRIWHPAYAELRHIEVRSHVDYDSRGEPVAVAGIVMDVSERRLAEARIAHLAHHDALTGLPNRPLFAIRLAEALARARCGEGFALFCLDLDRFKEVNDTFGHPVGDALLHAVTRRLRAELRDTDTLARLGGDEFAIIASRLGGARDSAALADRLVAVLAEPFELDGHHIVVGTSVGVAAAPDDGMDADDLLKNADMALYRAKLDGRGRVRFFEAQMDIELRARRAMERELRRALNNGEFELFFQPLIDTVTRHVTGFEALLRWRHPERGLIAPDNFVHLLEANGLIELVGAWALGEACRQAVRWPAPIKVAVNLSLAQFVNVSLFDQIERAVREAGLDPTRLELEITETVVLRDTETTLATLHRLKGLGVRIALDDFGTGYSSLSYLQKFPFDKVKIDRSFIANLTRTAESATIVRAVISLCTALGMATTAEGVESEAQFQAVAHERCAEAQGFHFGRPVPAEDVAGLLSRLDAAADAMAAADDMAWRRPGVDVGRDLVLSARRPGRADPRDG